MSINFITDKVSQVLQTYRLANSYKNKILWTTTEMQCTHTHTHVWQAEYTYKYHVICSILSTINVIITIYSSFLSSHEIELIINNFLKRKASNPNDLPGEFY